MAKGLTYFISLVIAVSICGCSTLPPKKNTRDFPLLYNNYLIKDYNKELDGNFIAYAKECAYGIPESGIKLAKLYQTTLDKNNPNYLYYQQEKFADIFNYCQIILRDNFNSITNKDEIAKTKELYQKFTKEEENSIKLAKNLLADTKPHTKESILNILYEFIKRHDFHNANHWQRELNKIVYSDTIGFYEAGIFLFEKEDTKYYGFKLVKASASFSYEPAMITLETKAYRKYQRMLYRKQNQESGK